MGRATPLSLPLSLALLFSLVPPPREPQGHRLASGADGGGAEVALTALLGGARGKPTGPECFFVVVVFFFVPKPTARVFYF